MAYNHQKIEAKWQKIWEDVETFKTDTSSDKPTFYALDMFPYPSGSGIHVGHPVGYVATDIVSRYKLMRGFNVLHPMGWDAFGLPAEQYAIEKGLHPAKTTAENCQSFKRQLKMLGLSYDWDRELSTADPDYYKWTQWIFLKLLEKGLAYQEEVEVNWCPALGTVLANDEVIDGVSERGGHPVYRKPMKQWMLKITDYADRLLEGLDRVEYPESLKAMQRERIGRSEGAEVDFKLEGHDEVIKVFTTRPDTLFGATFCVLSPEHPLVTTLVTEDCKKKVETYIEEASRKSELARTGAEAGKTGVFTGAFAINPVNREKLPIWVADYVLMGYGTGAIMCVPGHDQRDWDFATSFDLPIREVVSGGDVSQQAYSGDGQLVNSGFLDGLNKKEAINKMIAHLEESKQGKGTVSYRIRDWIFARQRYWGEPVPVIHAEDGSIVPVTDLPVELPDMTDFKPSGEDEAPLDRLKDWVNVTLEDGRKGRRETHTMPGSAGSSWYFLRFIDPHNGQAFCDPGLAAKWMPVDLYVGGAEHAVGHLLYSRFWTKFLYDIGECPVDEPFMKLINQGMMLGADNRKMSKRYGNVVNPDDVCRDLGADSLRLFEMFLGPIEKTPKIWSKKGIEGVRRFLDRVSRLVWDDEEAQTLSSQLSDDAPDDTIEKLRHKTIKVVTEDLEKLSLNTAISRLMEYTNELTKLSRRPRQAVETLVQLLTPFAPHLSEELWESLGHSDKLSHGNWPTYDEKLVAEDMVEIPVQVNGKIRCRIMVAVGLDKNELEKQATSHETVQQSITGKEVKKVVVVPDRLVNLVVVG